MPYTSADRYKGLQGNGDFGFSECWSHLGCKTMSPGKQFLTFWMIMLFTFSGASSPKKTVWLWRQRQYDPSKHQWLFTPRHSITPRRPQFDIHYYADLTGQAMAQTDVSLLPRRSWHTARSLHVADKLALWKVVLWVLRSSTVSVIPHSFSHSLLTLSNYSIWHHCQIIHFKHITDDSVNLQRQSGSIRH